MKIKKNLPLYLILSITIAFSCSSNHNSSLDDFEKLNDSLEVSIHSLREQNDSLYRVIATRLQDAKTYQKASLWVPKVEYLEHLTVGINNYIMEFYSARSFDSATRSTNAIYKKVSSYKYGVLRIDPEIQAAVNETANSITNFFDSVKQDNPAHFNEYLVTKSHNVRVIILKQTLYDILTTQNQVLKFCDNKTK